MFSRHASWVGYYLKNLIPNNNIILTNTDLSTYLKIPGAGRIFILLCKNLSEQNISIKPNLNNLINKFFNSVDDFTSICLYTNNVNATYIKYLYLVKNLVIRSQRARLVALLKPARGQRIHSNANSARYTNTFLNNFCKTYELELFNLTQSKSKNAWVHSTMRLLSKKQKKTKKINRPKVKVRKKTLWD